MHTLVGLFLVPPHKRWHQRGDLVFVSSQFMLIICLVFKDLPHSHFPVHDAFSSMTRHSISLSFLQAFHSITLWILKGTSCIRRHENILKSAFTQGTCNALFMHNFRILNYPLWSYFHFSLNQYCSIGDFGNVMRCSEANSLVPLHSARKEIHLDFQCPSCILKPFPRRHLLHQVNFSKYLEIKCEWNSDID